MYQEIVTHRLREYIAGKESDLYFVETAEGYEYTKQIDKATTFHSVQSIFHWLLEIKAEDYFIMELTTRKVARRLL